MRRSVRRPASAELGPEWGRVLRTVAARFASAGQRVWIVGGAVRDLALGRAPGDVDLASAATPEQVEGWFERTVPVGREFGTVVILADERQLQHTTFRSEQGYRDRRRPDQVTYGRTLEEDARRRDFTCNALYLDPLNDEFRDPEGGLADLEAGLLRAVGDARERFREDGLRLVRMARFAARLDLQVAPEVLAAAREQAGSLAGVSPERCLGELERIFAGPRSHDALRILVAAGLLAPLVPSATWAGTLPRARERLAWLEQLSLAAAPAGPGLENGLALLAWPEASAAPDLERAEAALRDLRASRATLRGVLARWRLLRGLEPLLDGAPASRARRVRLVRESAWPAAAALARARLAAAGRDPSALEELAAFASALEPGERHPEPLLDRRDLEAAGVAPGPRYGTLLAELEELQLEQTLATREQARAWLARRTAAG